MKPLDWVEVTLLVPRDRPALHDNTTSSLKI